MVVDYRMPVFEVGKNEHGWYAICPSQPGLGCGGIEDPREVVPLLERQWREFVIMASTGKGAAFVH